MEHRAESVRACDLVRACDDTARDGWRVLSFAPVAVQASPLAPPEPGFLVLFGRDRPAPAEPANGRVSGLVTG